MESANTADHVALRLRRCPFPTPARRTTARHSRAATSEASSCDGTPRCQVDSTKWYCIDSWIRGSCPTTEATLAHVAVSSRSGMGRPSRLEGVAVSRAACNLHGPSLSRSVCPTAESCHEKIVPCHDEIRPRHHKIDQKSQHRPGAAPTAPVASESTSYPRQPAIHIHLSRPIASKSTSHPRPRQARCPGQQQSDAQVAVFVGP